MLDEIIKAVESAGEIYNRAKNQLTDDMIEEKGSKVNLVTEYDKKIQDFLESELSELIPEAHFLDEEGDCN